MAKALKLGLAFALLVAAPAQAQDKDALASEWDGAPITAAETFAPPESPERWSVLTTFGDEPCPQAVGDEIIVCASLPESDRYRVPKDLRKTQQASVGEQSWGARVEAMDDMIRVNRPNSCSVVGSNGFTGCAAAALRTWFAERRSRQ